MEDQKPVEEIIEENQPLVLFDGVCNFCNGFIDFIIENDPEKKFHFVPLQSKLGEKIQEEFGLDVEELQSFIVVNNSEAYLRTDALIQVLRELGGFWKSIGFFVAVIPRPLRDLDYRLFSRFRYRLFGKKDECMVPDKDVRERFIEF